MAHGHDVEKIGRGQGTFIFSIHFQACLKETNDVDLEGNDEFGYSDEERSTHSRWGKGILERGNLGELGRFERLHEERAAISFCRGHGGIRLFPRA